MPRGGPCAAKRRPVPPRGGPVPPRGGPVPPRGGPVPPKGGPCAERRPWCREEALGAEMYSVLRGMEEALCQEEAPVLRGGPLCW